MLDDLVMGGAVFTLLLLLIAATVALLAMTLDSGPDTVCRDGLVAVQHETYSEIKNPPTFCTEIDK